jgi:hypothetical protein
MTATPATPAGLASRLFASGALAFFLLGMLPALFGVAIPVWASAFGLSPGEGGTLFATYNAGAVVTVLAGILGVPGLAMRPALALVALGSAGLALGPLLASSSSSAPFVAGQGLRHPRRRRCNRRFLPTSVPPRPRMCPSSTPSTAFGAILSPLLFLPRGRAPRAVFWGHGPPSPPLAPGPRAPRARPHRRPGPASPAPPPPDPSPSTSAPSRSRPRSWASAPPPSWTGGISEPSAARLVSAFFVLFVAGRLGLALVSHRLPPGRTYRVGVAGVARLHVARCGGPSRLGFRALGSFSAICFPASSSGPRGF